MSLFASLIDAMQKLSELTESRKVRHKLTFYTLHCIFLFKDKTRASTVAIRKVYWKKTMKKGSTVFASVRPENVGTYYDGKDLCL